MCPDLTTAEILRAAWHLYWSPMEVSHLSSETCLVNRNLET